MANARVIRRLMDEFCEMSGLNLNLRKSKVFFSKTAGATLKHNISDVLGHGQTLNLGKYLGIYLRHGRVTRVEAGRLIDKVSAKYAGWKKISVDSGLCYLDPISRHRCPNS